MRKFSIRRGQDVENHCDTVHMVTPRVYIGKKGVHSPCYGVILPRGFNPRWCVIDNRKVHCNSWLTKRERYSYFRVDFKPMKVSTCTEDIWTNVFNFFFNFEDVRNTIEIQYLISFNFSRHVFRRIWESLHFSSF